MLAAALDRSADKVPRLSTRPLPFREAQQPRARSRQRGAAPWRTYPHGLGKRVRPTGPEVAAVDSNATVRNGDRQITNRCLTRYDALRWTPGVDLVRLSVPARPSTRMPGDKCSRMACRPLTRGLYRCIIWSPWPRGLRQGDDPYGTNRLPREGRRLG